MSAEGVAARWAADPCAFSAEALGVPLWPHQAEVATSGARWRYLLAGRQSGKSRCLAVLALHRAATTPGGVVLLVSAGEVASRRLLADVRALAASSPVLAGSVTAEDTGKVVLANGAQIISVPASMAQIRGWAVDLLIIDEAGFVDAEVIRAAVPTIIARPGSRVVLASSPWGGPDHPFRRGWSAAMAGAEGSAAWHWPSTVSPLVDRAELARLESAESPDVFRREYLAEFTDVAGAYFTEAELMAAVADYALAEPGRVRGRPPVVGGVDWGYRRDANVLALVGVCDTPGGQRFYVPWLEAHHGMQWDDFIDRVASACSGYWVRVLASERNGVGDYPTEALRKRMLRDQLGAQVAAVWTDARRKQSGFGRMRGLLASGRLVLPRHPELLRQLTALTGEQTPSGVLRIAVPDGAGHDDVAMALMQAVSCLEPDGLMPDDGWGASRVRGGLVSTGAGAEFPAHPRPVDSLLWQRWPAGDDPGEGW